MKKILILGINYYPELTGIGKYTAEFSSILANQNLHNVDVITGIPYYPKWKKYNGYKNLFQKEYLDNVVIYRTPVFIPSEPSGFKRLIQDTLFLFNAWLVINYMLLFKNKKYDYIFIAVPSFTLGLIGIYYRFFSKKTEILYHIQDLQIDAAKGLNMITNRKLLNFLYSIEKYILKKVNHVSTISEGMREKILLKTTDLKECLLFPNWINSAKIYPLLPQPNIEGFERKKIIFYSGAIGEKQGLEIILETAAYFKNKTKFTFVISGEGPYKQKLISLSEVKKLKNIIFYNLLPLDQFNIFLNASHIHLVIQKEQAGDLVLPSKLTNILGVGGCAVITASPNTSLFNIIQTNDCGFLINPSDKLALCKAIEQLDEDHILYEKLKVNALKYAQNYLYQNNIINKYLNDIGLQNKQL